MKYEVWVLLFCIVFVSAVKQKSADKQNVWEKLNLPDEHIPYYFKNNPDVKQSCVEDKDCPYKQYVDDDRCWGYEKKCPEKKRMYMPSCPGDPGGWLRNGGGKTEQMKEFWKQADFGYVKERLSEMTTICSSNDTEDSHLECVAHTAHCHARNIYIDLRKVGFKASQDRNARFRENIFKKGDIGGYCKLERSKLKAMGDHKSPLQSWYAELEEFTSLKFHPIKDKRCDVVISKPTVFMKLDIGSNMYHHFCDFMNLYVAQHVNNSFNTDIKIIMWDTSPWKYGDFFEETFNVFSDYPMVHLNEYKGKRICVRDALFPLLPRMIHGLYYNMPLMPGCHNSSMYRAFSQHVLHRLKIKQEGPLKKKLRVTLLDRKSKYRNIMNQAEIVNKMKKYKEFEVKVVEYPHTMSFIDQLRITHNSDIFMCMHGAGLTHLLFLPDWGAVFEIYNCDDERCYKDLARQRGVAYFTWEKLSKLDQEDEGHHPQLGAHKKFTNYGFNVVEFMRIVKKMEKSVRENAYYKQAWKEKWGGQEEEGVKNEL